MSLVKPIGDEGCLAETGRGCDKVKGCVKPSSNWAVKRGRDMSPRLRRGTCSLVTGRGDASVWSVGTIIRVAGARRVLDGDAIAFRRTLHGLARHVPGCAWPIPTRPSMRVRWGISAVERRSFDAKALARQFGIG